MGTRFPVDRGNIADGTGRLGQPLGVANIWRGSREVAERLGRPQELFRSVWGQWMGAHSNGQHVRAHALYQEIFSFLDRLNEPEYVVQAHHAGGSQMVAEGAPRAAIAHIDHLLANYRMDVHGNLALFYGAHDPGCCSLGMRALSLLMRWVIWSKLKPRA